jgi:hypothetical protein
MRIVRIEDVRSPVEDSNTRYVRSPVIVVRWVTQREMEEGGGVVVVSWVLVRLVNPYCDLVPSGRKRVQWVEGGGHDTLSTNTYTYEGRRPASLCEECISIS